MNLAEIQSFRQIGRHLRQEREARGLTLPSVASSCGLAISELIRIENGELLGFKQVTEDTLTNAQIYGKILGVDLNLLATPDIVVKSTPSINDEVFIPAFLRKK